MIQAIKKDIKQLSDIQGMVKLDRKFKIVEKLAQKEKKPKPKHYIVKIAYQ